VSRARRRTQAQRQSEPRNAQVKKCRACVASRSPDILKGRQTLSLEWPDPLNQGGQGHPTREDGQGQTVTQRKVLVKTHA
jgi:hypothetical protein